MFIFYIIVIDHLNKIWNSFQISFYFGQGFMGQYYLRTDEIYFFNSPKVMNPLLLIQISSYSSHYTYCLPIINIFLTRWQYSHDNNIFPTRGQYSRNNNILLARWQHSSNNNTLFLVGNTHTIILFLLSVDNIHIIIIFLIVVGNIHITIFFISVGDIHITIFLMIYIST